MMRIARRQGAGVAAAGGDLGDHPPRRGAVEAPYRVPIDGGFGHVGNGASRMDRMRQDPACRGGRIVAQPATHVDRLVAEDDDPLADQSLRVIDGHHRVGRFT